VTEYAVNKSLPTNFPLIMMNRIVACTAINMFAITNLAGCVANVVQLMRGTASKPFPKWLAHWLNHRKNLGLLGFAGIMIHGCMGAIVSFHSFAEHFNFQDQISLFFANISILLYGILSISSLPGISTSLSWREWRFIQSRLGWLALCIGFTHDLLMTTPYWKYLLNGKPPSVGFISAMLPAFTITLKIILTLPPVSWRLSRVLLGKK
ncbi:Metalloreductase STEAP3, partial [Basidiobolus ranarum]